MAQTVYPLTEITERRKVFLNTLDTDPPTQTVVNFVTDGYANGDPIDVEADGIMTFSLTNIKDGTYATIIVAGAPVEANGLYYYVADDTDLDTIAEFRYNAPAEAGTYRSLTVYTKPGYEDYVTDVDTLTVLSING